LRSITRPSVALLDILAGLAMHSIRGEMQDLKNRPVIVVKPESPLNKAGCDCERPSKRLFLKVQVPIEAISR
jgi:hypothetical protein